MVATDSMEIAEVAKELVAVHLDNKEEAWCGTRRCANLYRVMWEEYKDAGVIINWQMDEPCVLPRDIRKLSARFAKSPCDIATLVAPLTHDAEVNPNRVKAAVQYGECKSFDRSPVRGSTHEHVGIYAFRPSVLKRIGKLSQTISSRSISLEQITWLDHGYSIDAVEVKNAPLSINTIEDYESFVASR
jgi:3-deoxy-manno-octulosonate cytidylyltransferase (CMP-KDO synthetase)